MIRKLNQKLSVVLQEVQESAYWQEFCATSTPNDLRLETMKWILREISKYQLEVNKAVFLSVGSLGNHIEEQGLIRAMISVQIEEVGHGTVALNDFYELGGTKEEAAELPSPAGLAILAVVRHLSEHYHPLCHLGYMYFFEKFTVMITELVAPILTASGYPNDSLEFMKLHALEDERHSAMLEEVINECLTRYEDAEKQIQYGFDCFREVYPHRLWSSALEMAKNKLVWQD